MTRIKIIRPGPLGLNDRHTGITYDADCIDNGYVLRKVWRGTLQPRVTREHLAAGHAELVEPEICGYIPS